MEKNKIRSFSYSTAVQRITLSTLMFFNNRNGCYYQCFTNKKIRNIKKLKQNLRINEKAFDNFKWTAEEDVDVSNPKLFPVQLFICSSGKEVRIWMRTLLGATTILTPKPLYYFGFERSSRNQYKIYNESAGQYIFFNIIFNSSSSVYDFCLFTLIHTMHGTSQVELPSRMPCPTQYAKGNLLVHNN